VTIERHPLSYSDIRRNNQSYQSTVYYYFSIILSSSMEFPNCTVAIQSSSPHPLSSTARNGRECNENSLNAALAFQLYASASARYNALQDERSDVLRDGYAVTPTLQSHSRPYVSSLPYPQHSRPLSDILDEAINISNEILLQDRNGDPRVTSTLLLQRQSQDIGNQTQQRRTRKMRPRRHSNQPPQ
jgi:hypothetical protein